MRGVPVLLRPPGRRAVRRFVFVSALACMLVLVPGVSASAPLITPVIFGTLGANGWYTSNLTINWTFDGPVESTSGCDAKTITADTTGTTFTCTATRDGFTTSVTKTFKVDKTAPAVSAALDRQPDANGWYNHALTVAFKGTDATSGLESCTSVRYAGPDSVAATVAGFCRDVAGNVASASSAFKYDATAPMLFGVTAARGNRSAQIAWRKSSDTKRVEVIRAPGRSRQGESMVYRGSQTGFRDTGLIAGRKYEYRVAAIDDAANRSEQKLDILATGALLNPAPGQKVKGAPLLAWTRVKRATYYNIQLIRGHKVLSAWPATTSYRLRRTWTYQGRRYRLRPGLYRWYVWPGFGPLSEARYAKHALGSSTFVVTK
ncbi:MAG TPA: hypothetical protein VFO03_03915 [Gaiellaceae bacterium]|nr:hypothetical protein [Gaiellaceae bacterium]